MIKKQLFEMTGLFIALLMLGACTENEVDKTTETLKALTGNWLYTSEEDMQCYLITFYESGQFLYQSQEVDVKKSLVGMTTYNEEENSITLMPNTDEPFITFLIGDFDSAGKKLSLTDGSGRLLAFDKTPLTQLPVHDNWKPWEPLNVNDKTYLEETAKEFMAFFQANDFKNLTDIARGIKDYDTGELYQWQKECIESMTTLINGRVEHNQTDIHDYRNSDYYNYDYEVRDYFYYYTDYKRLLNVSNFKGHFAVQGGKWVYTQANDLQFVFNDRQGNQCVLKIVTSGATKTVFTDTYTNRNTYSTGIWYDEYGNVHQENVTERSTTNSYLVIPERISLTFTQGGQALISATADFDLTTIGGEKWDLSRNGISSVVKATVNGYDINSERIVYSPTSGTQAKLLLTKDGSLILSMDIEGTGYADITAEKGMQDFDTSTLGSAKASIDVMGKIQFYADISDIHNIRRAIENANDNSKKENDFKRYLERANDLYNAHFRYAYEDEPHVRGSLTLEAFAENGKSGETWIARPIITFSKDNSSYAIDSYFTENRFRTITNAFWNLLDDFEDLGKSIGNGATWGDNTKLKGDNFAFFDNNGGERTLQIQCSGQWTVTDIPSWLTVSPTSGTGNTAIRVYTGSYTGNEARVAKIYVKSGSQKRSILVMQVATDGGKQLSDPAAEVEGCYSYPYGSNGHGFVSLKRISANQVRLTYLYCKYVIEMTDPVDLSVTQTPEGFIYLKGRNVEGSYYVEDNYSWTRHLYLSFQDENNTTVFLQKKDNSSGCGTLNDPFNAAAASAVAEYLGSYSDESQRDIYIKGKVASITDNYGTQYGNATFKISDDGTDNNSFTIYRALYLGNKKYTSGELIKVGDDVIICGKVVFYNSKIPETITGKAYLYSLNGYRPVKHWIYGKDPSVEPPFQPSAWDAAAMRFSSTEGAHLPTIPDDVYFGLKTLIFDVSDVSEDFDLKVMNGWWSSTYYDHVKWQSGLNAIQITETMAKECAQGGQGRDLDLMLYSGTCTINSVYYEE